MLLIMCLLIPSQLVAVNRSFTNLLTEDLTEMKTSTQEVAEIRAGIPNAEILAPPLTMFSDLLFPGIEQGHKVQGAEPNCYTIKSMDYSFYSYNKTVAYQLNDDIPSGGDCFGGSTKTLFFA